jgi:hypothetical protein
MHYLYMHNLSHMIQLFSTTINIIINSRVDISILSFQIIHRQLHYFKNSFYLSWYQVFAMIAATIIHNVTKYTR